MVRSRGSPPSPAVSSETSAAGVALELERAQQSGRVRKTHSAPAVAQVLREWGTVPAAPSAHSLMAAQLQLVGKVFPQLQAQARQLVTSE